MFLSQDSPDVSLPARPGWGWTLGRGLLLGLAALAASTGSPTLAQELAEAVDYARDVKPLLAHKCYACHGVLRQEASLRLETRGLMLAGGDSGPVIEPGDSDASLILARVMAEDASRMPPEGEGAALTDAEVALVRKWIDSGAAAPEEPVPSGPEEHWAFQPPRRTPPASLPAEAPRHPIDRLLYEQHQRLGLQPVPEAEPELLLRRLHLDLLGVPPTLEDLQRFTEDPGEETYRREVRRLLADPRYGERWGRHWMDVWRYSDWYGLGEQVRNSQKHIWRWRDWIVQSLNEDRGYDEFVRLMLAADELAPEDPAALPATGFLARQYYLFNRTTWMDDTIEHVGKAFLGLTLNCAKCHSHKYDPISHEEYYRFRAIFEPYQVRLDAVPGEIDLAKDGLPRAFDAHPDAPTYVHVRGDEKHADTSRPIEPGPPEVLGGEYNVRAIPLPPVAWNPALQEFVLRDQLAAAQREIESARLAYESARDAHKAARHAEDAAATQSAESDVPGEAFLEDSFDEARPDLWEMSDGEWSYHDGRLSQSRIGPSRASLRSLRDHPPDFEASVVFAATGGERWKSVGLTFDVGEGREQLVYLSAVQPGAKLQVSYKQNQQQAYPPEAAQPRNVELNTDYRLEIRVRGDLINVAVDGRHALAFRTPLPRRPGRMELITYDASATFDSIRVSALPESQPLIEPGAGGPLTAERAALMKEAAERKLAAARLRPDLLRAAWAAEQALATQQENEESAEVASGEMSHQAKEEVRAAALATRQHELAVALARLAEAKVEALDKAGAEAAETVEKATAAVEQARRAVAEPGDSFPRLRASEKSAEGPDEKEASRLAAYPKASSGRRAALARWLTDHRNPLTARVAVNHIWLRHFGQPLVESVADFGLRSPRPEQAELLDWLAVELMEHDWSMKHLHELILTSAAWRRSSSTVSADAATLSQDPGNQHYWRRLPLRMESQVIRDSLLHLAGELDLTMGGPPVDANSDTRRRSLYLWHSRDDRSKFLDLFDDADILRCYRRSESVVPQQALALANSELALGMARKLSDALDAGTSDDQQFVERAFASVLSSRPEPDELQICLQSLREMRRLAESSGADPERASRIARQNLVHALVNHNDFITIR